MEPSKILLVILILTAQASGVKWSSSIGTIERMVKFEDRFLQRLINQTNEAEASLTVLKSKLFSMQNIVSDIKMNFTEHFEQPIKQLLLARRYVTDWRILDRLLKKFTNISERMTGNMTKAVKVFPKEGDQHTIRHALLRLQNMYKLNTTELARGKVKGEHAGRHLTAKECLEIGQSAFREGFVEMCEEWNREAEFRLKHSERRSVQNRWMTRSLKNCSNTKERTVDSMNEEINQKLCNLKDTELSHKKGFKCYFWTNHNNPWLILQPVKMELLWHKPRVVRFYDVISDDEIKMLIKKAKPLLDRGSVVGEDDEFPNIRAPRVGHVAWLFDNDTLQSEDGKEHSSALEKITGRVGNMVGLDMSTSNAIQIGHYGVGGHFSLHTDNFRPGSEAEIEEGNRIATFMFYMSNVKHGGRTVFETPQISVRPIKGSAVLWYNILPDGRGDNRSVHAGCPIIVGSKWLAIKWIHETKIGWCRNTEYYDGWVEKRLSKSV